MCSTSSSPPLGVWLRLVGIIGLTLHTNDRWLQKMIIQNVYLKGGNIMTRGSFSRRELHQKNQQNCFGSLGFAYSELDPGCQSVPNTALLQHTHLISPLSDELNQVCFFWDQAQCWTALIQVTSLSSMNIYLWVLGITLIRRTKALYIGHE